MLNLTDMQTIRALAKRYDFSFSKGLGQNFLIDPEVCPAIAEYGIPEKSCGVLEIGTGFGVLTQQLALRSEQVAAVEVDRRLAPVLEETLAEFDNVRVVWQDIMKLDPAAFLREQFGERDVAVCANLPYYITSPILMHLLESDAKFVSITVMVQKEAAERLCAEIGSRAAGAVTAAVQLRGRAEQLFDVPRDSFYPAPNHAVCRAAVYAGRAEKCPAHCKGGLCAAPENRAECTLRRTFAAEGADCGGACRLRARGERAL